MADGFRLRRALFLPRGAKGRVFQIKVAHFSPRKTPRDANGRWLCLRRPFPRCELRPAEDIAGRKNPL
jgi:hypothetical protein